MGPGWLLKRMAALLAAGGLLAASVTGISADEGGEESAEQAALQPTQVVAEIPEEYDVLFPLEWGGGSLLHLKGRLATMGCIADTIWVWDNNKWNPYNQYQVPHTLPVIQEFKQTYTDYIPATTIYADCTNICEFQDRECLTFDEQRKRENNYKDRPAFIVPLTDSDSCTTNFNPKVTSQVLPNLPTRPDTCIVTKQLIDGGGVAGVAPSLSINTTPFVVLFDDPTPYRTPTEHTDILLKMEIHELCHINQTWHWVQQLQFNFNSDDFYHPTRYLSNSPHGQTFINLVGYKKNTDGVWTLPFNSVYRDIYSKEPIELAAELCAMYLAERMGERSSYDYERYNYETNRYREIPIHTTNINTYLTPQIREWLETYMILPEIAD